MKKTYINPTLEVVRVKSQQLLAGSAARSTGLEDITDGEYTGETPVKW